MSQARVNVFHPRSPARRWAWAVAALLHLLLLAFFLQARQSSLKAAAKTEPPARWVTMRLFNRPSMRPQDLQKDKLERATPETRMPSRLQGQAQSAPPSALPITPPGEPVTARLAAQLPPPEPAASSPEPLKLELPLRQAIGAAISPAEMARLDPRSNTRRPDVGERIASALGSPAQTEEQIAPGHTRIRQGSTCLDVQDARVSQLFPFDPMARGAPKMVSSCKK